MKIKCLTETIAANLPSIDGVAWHVDMYREPISLDYGFLIAARFKVPETLSVDEIVSRALGKAHEITSAGQIKLDIEK